MGSRIAPLLARCIILVIENALGQQRGHGDEEAEQGDIHEDEDIEPRKVHPGRVGQRCQGRAGGRQADEQAHAGNEGPAEGLGDVKC